MLGACRKDELANVKTSDVPTYYDKDDSENKRPIIYVKIPHTKTGKARSFTIKNNLVPFVEEYQNLRPKGVSLDRYFLNYQKGKCTNAFLNLPDVDTYTGHCFRKTSATLLVEGGADITTLKRHGGWKSNSVAESYIEALRKNEPISHQHRAIMDVIPKEIPRKQSRQVYQLIWQDCTSKAWSIALSIFSNSEKK